MLTFGTVVRRSRGWLPLIAATALAGTLSTLALPAVLGRAVDAVIAGADSGPWVLRAAALIGVGVLVDLIDAFAAGACVAGTTAWLRDRLVRHVLALGTRRAPGLDTGDLVSRVSGNAPDAAQAGPGIVVAATALIPPVGSLVLLAVIDPWLAVAFLVGVGLVALVLTGFTRRTGRLLSRYQQIQGTLAARLAESLTGARTIAAAGTLDRERHRILEPLPELHAQGRLTWHTLARAGAQAAVVGPLVLVAVLTAGGLALLDGRISAGELFAAGQYAVLGAGLGGLTGVLSRLARARAGVARLAEVLTADPCPTGSAELPPLGTGALVFRAVSVHGSASAAAPGSASASAPGSASGAGSGSGGAAGSGSDSGSGGVHGEGGPLLADVNLAIPGGATVAVVGRSGAGKSVLAGLACRLHEPDRGEVLLDGVPLHRLRRDVLRTAVGCAFERPALVGHTLGDAIGQGRGHAVTDASARATQAHDFISRLPDGYGTALAQAPLSGGEAQRLGLARAWHAERLLILDDATSSLDVVTEMRVHRALEDDPRRRTVLIVTHRVSTAARADTVIWLDAGRVRAVGPHRTLWDDPAYREVFG